jgi:hypothetical protein
MTSTSDQETPPAQKLDYASPPPVDHCPREIVIKESDGGVVVIMPPPTYWKLLLLRGFGVLISSAAIAAVAFTIMSGSGAWCVLASGLMAGLFLVGTIRSLLLAGRFGKMPASISISRDAVIFENHRDEGHRTYRWPRDEVKEIKVSSAITATFGRKVTVGIAVRWRPFPAHPSQTLVDEYSTSFFTRKRTLPRDLRELFNKHLAPK